MSDNREILQAIEKQGERFEHSVDKLTTHTIDMSQSLGNLAQAIKFQTTQSAESKPKANGNGSAAQTWTLLFGVGGLIFGLLAPLYFMLMVSGTEVSDLRTDVNESVRAAESRIGVLIHEIGHRIATNEAKNTILTADAARQASMFKEMEAQMRGLCFKHAARMAALEHKTNLHVYNPAICATLVSPGSVIKAGP